MSRLRVLPIVEGHGEQQAIRPLLEGIWYGLLGGEYLEVLRPIRQPRSKLIQRKELERALDLAALKLGRSPDPGMVLVLLDADHDAPCELGPELLERCLGHRQDVDVACVLANVEYETWLIAGCEALEGYLDLEAGGIPSAPEEQRLGKAWIASRVRGPKYSETVDQPAMSAALDPALCRRRSPSFDKLCRELKKRQR